MSQCLEVDSVVKYFGEQADILSDVSLHCYPGEIIGIFGRNGTGKSTLFNIIFGSLKAQNAFIRINGKVCKRSPFLSGLIAYLPQHTYLPLYLSVKEVVKAYVSKEQVSRFLGDKFLFKRRDAKVRDLSGGELRYLEVKLILFCQAPYILLDEPFNGLSPVAIEAIREYIQEVSSEKGIILSDHNFRDVHKVITRIMLLDQCVLKQVANPEELIPYGYYER